MRNELVSVVAVLSMIVIAVPALVAAQQTEAPVEPAPAAEGDFVTKIFKITYADVKDIASVISLFGGGTRPNPTLRVIAWTGPEADLPAVEAAIRALDVAPVPEPNVELMIYFLFAGKEAATKTDVPAALDGVAVQLEDVFGYTNVRLIEVTAMRVRNGSHGKIDGILPQRLADNREARYSFSFQRLFVTEDSAGRSIRLDGLEAGVQAPHTFVEDGQDTTRYLRTGISTDIDLREGQKAVIGKTSIEGGAETVFVVVTGTIIE